MKFFIFQSKIVGEQFLAIFTQILMATVHQQSFFLKDCSIAREGFFQVSIYNFAFVPLLEMLLHGNSKPCQPKQVCKKTLNFKEFYIYIMN